MKHIVYFLIIVMGLSACDQQTNTRTDGKHQLQTKNIELVKQYFEYFNQHEWAPMADMYADPGVFKDPSLGPGMVEQTRAEIILKYAQMNELFPDLHDEVVHIYPSGEQHVIVEFVSTGTAPDSSTFELPICTIFTIEQGIITKDFTYFDHFEEGD